MFLDIANLLQSTGIANAFATFFESNCLSQVTFDDFKNNCLNNLETLILNSFYQESVHMCLKRLST